MTHLHGRLRALEAVMGEGGRCPEHQVQPMVRGIGTERLPCARCGRPMDVLCCEIETVPDRESER
jgi:hypothetical protein